MRGAVVLSLNADVDGLLEAGQLGYLAGTFDKLRLQLEQLASDTVARESLAQRARAIALQRYSTANLDSLVAVLRGESRG